MTEWYRDKHFSRHLALRYRAYAAYWRLLGRPSSRRVRGGSFLLRLLKRFSNSLGLATTVRVSGLNDLVVVADFSDERILDVIYEIRGQNPECEAMRRLLKEGDTFIDVGANFGTFSLLASQIVGKNGRVIAIEPQRRLTTMLRESVALSRVENINIVEAACGASTGLGIIFVPPDDSGRGGLVREFSARKGFSSAEVQVVTLDSVVERYPPSGDILVKIDVEGSEISVLEGGAKLLSQSHPSLLLEQNPQSAVAAGHPQFALLELIAEAGYQTYALEDFVRHEFAPVPRDGAQRNLVAVHEGAERASL